MNTGPFPSLWPWEKLKVPPPPGSVRWVRLAAPAANVVFVRALPAAVAISANKATCTQAVCGAVQVTGVDAVAVTGLLIAALGSAAWMVAKQRFMVGSFHQIEAGGIPPAVM